MNQVATWPILQAFISDCRNMTSPLFLIKKTNDCITPMEYIDVTI